VLDGMVVLIRCAEILALYRCDLYGSALSLSGRYIFDELFNLPFASWGDARLGLAGRSGVRTTGGAGYARV